MTRLHLDFETHSHLDLREVGVYRYAESSQTGFTCVAWAIDDAPVKAIPLIGPPGRNLASKIPNELFDAITDPEVEKHAWNANFERVMLSRDTQAGFFHPSVWRCTMVRAAYWGLPMSLEDASEALNLPFVKDMAGHRLMKRMAKPDKNHQFLHDTEPHNLDRLMEYCANDVVVERAVANELPELPASEQEMWEIDQRMNDRGWTLDFDLVCQLFHLAADETRRLEQEFKDLTAGVSPSQVQKSLEWLKSQGVDLPGLTKADVAAALSRDNVADIARRVLEIRQEIAKSSTKKLDAMMKSKCGDGRVRGLVQFYGASRTGRMSGRLVQIQNFPRPTIKDVKGAVADVLR